jgi:hypothetical protein
MRLTRGFKLTFIFSAIAIAAMILVDYITPVPPEDRLRVLREEMNDLRAAADSCRSVVDREEAELLASDAYLDSLRGELERYEKMDPRGVPGDSYEVYIETFNEYNAGIPARATAGDTLQVHWKACREITESHNQLADSARTLAEEAGLLRETPGRIPAPDNGDPPP